jgi:hypothetical protein
MGQFGKVQHWVSSTESCRTAYLVTSNGQAQPPGTTFSQTLDAPGYPPAGCSGDGLVSTCPVMDLGSTNWFANRGPCG